MNQLEPNARDRLVSVAKSSAGALPFVGNLVSEIMDTVVPNLRFERVVSFLKVIDKKVGSLDEKFANFERHLKSEEGLDVFEEGILQASRAVSEERKQRLARLVARSLSSKEMKYAETRKLLNLYNELTDPEIVWLIYYSLDPVLGKGPHTNWAEMHPDILDPISKTMGAPQEQYERAALQDSYKSTLIRLGLVKERNKTKSITTLGRLLVKYIESENIKEKNE